MKLQRLFCLFALISAVSMANAAKEHKELPQATAPAGAATAKKHKPERENARSSCWSARYCTGKSRANSTLEACKESDVDRSWGPAPGSGCTNFR